MRRLALSLALIAIGLATQAGAAPGRRFDVRGFRQVDLRGPDNVVVRFGPAFSVTATGPEAVLRQLTAEIRGDTLRIGQQGNHWRRRPAGLATITVVLPLLTGAAVSGSGDMTVAPFRTPRFSGAVAGSGDLRLVRIETGTIALSVAGSGDLSAAGRADTATLSVAGSGDLDAGALDTATLSASVAGSGDLIARAQRSAGVSLVGSGDITVRGPARCAVRKIGSGDVRCNVA